MTLLTFASHASTVGVSAQGLRQYGADLYLAAACVDRSRAAQSYLETHYLRVVSPDVWKFERWRILPGVNTDPAQRRAEPEGMRHGETYQEPEACGA